MKNTKLVPFIGLLAVYCLLSMKGIAQESSTVNRSPTLAAIADQVLCYTKDPKTILLNGISPGPETIQQTSLTVTTDHPGLFDQLEVNLLANNNGYLKYHLQKGQYGTARITVTVKDDGGIKDGGVDTFSKVFTVTVYGPPVISIRSEVIADDITANGKGGQAGPRFQKIRLLASGLTYTSYAWSPQEGLNDPETTEPVFTPVIATAKTFFLHASDRNGCQSVDSITLNPIAVSNQKIDLSAFPNPTGKKTNIKFSMQKEQFVSLTVYQANGTKVANLFSGKVNARQVYQVGFDTAGMVEGVYVVKLSSINDEKTLKLLVTQ